MPRRERGEGTIYRPRYTDRHGERKEASIYWWRVSLHGVKQKPVCTGCKTYPAARAWARERLCEMAKGDLSALTADTVTLEHLERMVKDDYAVNGRRTRRHIPLCFGRLRKLLGNAKAKDLTTARLKWYAAQRIEAGAAPATVMLDFALLGKGANLAARDGLIPPRPKGWLPRLRVDNARQGFFERPALNLILSHLPEDLRGAATAAYITGWRLASDILTREWRHVDLEAGWFRLFPGEGKTGKPRLFPLTPELRAVLEAQRRYTDEVERALGRIVPLVFHRRGKRITTMVFHWNRARKTAGLPKAQMHDFRRTAARDIVRAGKSEKLAMELIGLKTEAIFRRHYLVVDEEWLQEAGRKLGEFHEAKRAEAAKVTAMRRG